MATVENRISRRGAIRRAALGFAMPMIIPRSVLGGAGQPGANERVGVGAIGVGFRSNLLLDQLPEDGRIVALSDCNLPRAEGYKAKHKGDWPVFQDHRKLLERKDIDAVIVGTAEFQRVLPCIHACQAGKDIYAEKPLTLYIREGRVLVDHVRRHKRIFQVGTQQRSMELNRIACKFVREGGLGTLREVRAVIYPGPMDAEVSAFPEQPTPEGMNWDVWLNQAAERPYNEKWMGWMFFRDFSGGQMTNWGAHGVDQIHWALGVDDTGPVAAWPVTPGPNGQVRLKYPSGIEVHFGLERGPMGGAVFVGEKGKLEINRNKITSNPPEIASELIATVDAAAEERKWSDETALWQARYHMQDWIDCIRTRELPVADVEIGHRSISACHIANIARRLSRRLEWDPAAEQFKGDGEANREADRPRREGYELPAV